MTLNNNTSLSTLLEQQFHIESKALQPIVATPTVNLAESNLLEDHVVRHLTELLLVHQTQSIG